MRENLGNILIYSIMEEERMETNEILTNGMDAVEEIVSEGFKMGKGTKIGLATLVAGLAAYGVYKTVKFFGKKKESEEIDDVSAEYDEVEEDENIEE